MVLKSLFSAVDLNLDPKLRDVFSLLLQTHVTCRRALLEIHTTPLQSDLVVHTET